MNFRRASLVGLTVSGLAAAGWFTARASAAADLLGARTPAAPAASASSELARRDVQIAVWGQALEQDSASAIALAQLAGLHLQRARESGDHADYGRAESYARRSLAERTNRNGKTYVTLASSLLAQHRFGDARDVATQLVAAEPDVPEYRALLGEVQLELGDYAGARVSFDSLRAARTHLSVAPRLARWAELEGLTGYARTLLRGARDEAARRGEVPREQRAWFNLRLGDFELRHGRLREAAQAFDAGLAVEPNDHRLLSALARLEAVRGRPARAIEYGERAIAFALDPATLGLLSDAYAARGDAGKAADYARAMDVAVSGQPGPYHRAWGLFLLDHDRRVPEVLASAVGELVTRRDVYGYDLLAWALYKSGRYAEAGGAADTALQHGAHDATVLFHAGMIARAGGHDARARTLLARALAVNPVFAPTQPTTARAVLDSLEREPGGGR